MSWLTATAIVERHAAETLSETLLEAGALSVDVSDADAGTRDERPIFDEPGGAPSPGWLRARIAALFAADADVPRAVAHAFEGAGLNPSTGYEVQRVDDDDWVRRTRTQFTPVKVTPRLWIVPTWHSAPDPAAINIVLDPGLAFGTGTHPTTQLCLRWLVERVRSGLSVIDFGCGSGVLAIAAAKLGAGAVSGVDIDPQAVRAATDNAARNDIQATFVSAAGALPGRAAIVVANILAQPLCMLAPLLADLTASHGSIALSGILGSQADEVADVYREWFDLEPTREDDGWVLISGVRRS